MKKSYLVFLLLLQLQIVAIPIEHLEQLLTAKKIAKEAGQIVLEIRHSESLTGDTVELENGKKVRQTNADLKASTFILQELGKRYPSYGLLSQDHMSKDSTWYQKESVWIVNAIDGTKAYEKGSDDFHVQIGLLVKEEVVLGVSYYPATEQMVFAVKGHGAWIENNIVTQKIFAHPSSDKVLIRSSSHPVIKGYLPEWGWDNCKVLDEGLSSTSRLLKIIQGEASLYISLGASPLGHEKKGGLWNYAATGVIAKETGILLSTLNGKPLNFRQPDGLLPCGVLMTNDAVLFYKVAATGWGLDHFVWDDEVIKFLLSEDSEL